MSEMKNLDKAIKSTFKSSEEYFMRDLEGRNAKMNKVWTAIVCLRTPHVSDKKVVRVFEGTPYMACKMMDKLLESPQIRLTGVSATKPRLIYYLDIKSKL